MQRQAATHRWTQFASQESKSSSGIGNASCSSAGTTAEAPLSSSSCVNHPDGARTVVALIRAIWARRYAASVHGKGGYVDTGASRWPTRKRFRARAARMCSGRVSGSRVSAASPRVLQTKYWYSLDPVPGCSAGYSPAASRAERSA